MSVTSIPTIKTLAMAESCLLSLPSLFYNKTKHPHLSYPSKPLKLQLSCPNSSLSLPSLSLTRKTQPFLTSVAQTSDWAPQGEDNTVTVEDNEPTWENQEVESSDREPEVEDAAIEGSQGEEESGADGGFEETEFVEPPEDAKIFVGNLPFDVDSQKLAMLFEKAGTVEIAEVRL